MRRLAWSICAVLAGLAGAAGCNHCGYGTRASSSAYSRCDPAPRLAYLRPSVPVPGPCCAPPPCNGSVNPGYSSAAPLSNTAPPPLAAAIPPGDAGAGPGVRLSGPEPVTAAAPPEPTRPVVPETPAPPLAKVPGANEQQPATPQPGAGQDKPATPALAVGIPQFAIARKGVAAGLRPILDGLDWLANNGYRTVLHLRQPGQDDSSDRKQFEGRGLRYVSLEVSAETLGRDVEEFNRLVGAAANQPLFVYDKDGVLAGALWYLNFRVAEGVNDAEARARAARLGLKEDAPGDAKLMWVAVQRYLENRKL